jgi:acyl carrier protein
LVRRANSKYRVYKSRNQSDEQLVGALNWESFMNPLDIKTTVKTFILNEYLPGEDPAALTDTTPLVTTGILDSIAVLKVVTFLENQFGITIQPHEAVVENLNTLSDIARLVMLKKA